MARNLALVRDHVVGGAGVEAADRDDDGVEHVELPGHHRLQREHHLAGGGDRVRGPVRLGGVPAAPVHGDRDLVGRGQHRARPGGEHPARELVRRHVQGVGRDRALAGRVEHALADHVPGAGVALLARLEHEDHRAGQVGLPRREQLRGAGQHGRVQVVTAGVHRARHRRRVRQPGLLGDRQRVHVAAQQHDRPRPGMRRKCRPPRSTAVTELSAWPVLISSGSPSRASSTLACVFGRSRPISGSRWIACRSSAISPASFAASSRTGT